MNGENAPRLPNTSNIMVDYAEGEGLVISLDLKGVAVSTGSACSSGSLEPSHVLTAIGKTPDEAHGSLRFSLSSMNTEEDVDYVLEVLPGIVERLRELSPLQGARRINSVTWRIPKSCSITFRTPGVGEMPTDAVAEVSNPVCGDVMKLWVKVEAG